MFFSTYPRISFIECLPYIAGMDGAFDLKGKKTCKDCKQPNRTQNKGLQRQEEKIPLNHHMWQFCVEFHTTRQK